MNNQDFFKKRMHGLENLRDGDIRSPYERDRARVLHSAFFRRLQGKTQVMGVGEGDFHRTRLTHSMECAQIGRTLLGKLREKVEKEEIPIIKEDPSKKKCILKWLPCESLVEAACLSHDLGHPPYGHKGEQVLHEKMKTCGGFEGNAQTLRILCRLEKYKAKNKGIDPTRRLVLSVLKYPAPYSAFKFKPCANNPPKCYYDSEKDITDWAFKDFSKEEISLFSEVSDCGKTEHKTLDCSIMELADDIAYGVHDMEDMISRSIATQEEFEESFRKVYGEKNKHVTIKGEGVGYKCIAEQFYENSFTRKQIIGELVNAFVSKIDLEEAPFDHPILRYRAILPEEWRDLLKGFKGICRDLIISRPQSQHLEWRGGHIVEKVFDVLSDDPDRFIHKRYRDDWPGDECEMRLVCDYIASMTDGYMENMYQRLFVPGFGSSTDEM